MNQVNLKNEKIKRAYLTWRKEAKGDSEKTIYIRERAINFYSDFTKAADFRSFNKHKATDFKEFLRRPLKNGHIRAENTIRTILLHIRDFFTWLCGQPGYRRIAVTDIDYFKVSKKESRIAAQSKVKSFPDLEYVINLISSINVKNEIDMRDRAVISFLACTGLRDSAICTLPLGCIDERNLRVYQYPNKGVETKFSKNISSLIFSFDKKLVQYILNWIKHLKKRGFSDKDPFFPKPKIVHGEGSYSYSKATEVVPEFWESTNGVRRIIKERAEAANLPYYNPHTFRDAAINLACKYSNSNLQLRAISQSFGHDNVITTLSNYGNLNDEELFMLLKQIDFSKGPDISNQDLINELKKFLNKHKN